jgi:hypothetical protein
VAKPTRKQRSRLPAKLKACTKPHAALKTRTVLRISAVALSPAISAEGNAYWQAVMLIALIPEGVAVATVVPLIFFVRLVHEWNIRPPPRVPSGLVQELALSNRNARKTGLECRKGVCLKAVTLLTISTIKSTMATGPQCNSYAWFIRFQISATASTSAPAQNLRFYP